MNDEQYDKFIDELATTLDDVLTFEVRRKAIYAFKTPTEYIACLQHFQKKDDGNKSLRRLENLFHFDTAFYSKIVGRKLTIDGKQRKYLADVLRRLRENSKTLHFIGKKDVKYKKSGKKFSHKSFVLIDSKMIYQLFNDKTWGLACSNHYSKTAQRIIHETLLETVMTKKEKEQYKKEYDEGKHVMTLEQYIADERKKQRRADKHRMTIAKKAARQTIADYAKLEMENMQLKKEIEYLKQLKDLNSDIPQEEKFVEKPLDRIYYDVNEVPWDDLPEDDVARDKWIVEHCSDDVKKQLRAEVDECEKRLEHRGFDYSTQISNVKKLCDDMKAESDKKQAKTPAPAFDNSDLDESDATVISVNTGEKVIDCAMELYGATDEAKARVKQNKLIPIDSSMRFFYFGLDKQNNCYRILDVQRNEVHYANRDGRFEVGQAKNPYYFEKSNIKLMQSKMNDKYYYSNKFLSYLWKNYQDKHNKAVEILTESLGFTPRRDFAC